VLYGVETRALKQAVKRNPERFPEDFMFELADEELDHLRSQNVISSSNHGGSRYRPYALTEHGVVMAAGGKGDTFVDEVVAIGVVPHPDPVAHDQVLGGKGPRTVLKDDIPLEDTVQKLVEAARATGTTTRQVIASVAPDSEGYGHLQAGMIVLAVMVVPLNVPTVSLARPSGVNATRAHSKGCPPEASMK
jgi:hypothetical protein